MHNTAKAAAAETPVCIEYHYRDGDVGVHPASPYELALWNRVPNPKRLTRILLRADTEPGQRESDQQLAAGAALRACAQLVLAYAKSGVLTDKVDWSDVDAAHEQALNALNQAGVTLQADTVALHFQWRDGTAFPSTDCTG